MIVPIRPPLSGISAQRYLAHARTLGRTSLEDEPQRRRLYATRSTGAAPSRHWTKRAG